MKRIRERTKIIEKELEKIKEEKVQKDLRIEALETDGVERRKSRRV